MSSGPCLKSVISHTLFHGSTHTVEISSMCSSDLVNTLNLIKDNLWVIHGFSISNR